MQTGPMFMDADLSRRLERTEGMVGASFAAARNAVAQVGAMSRELGGVIAIFDGPDSPMTQTFGLGLVTAATADQLAQLEAFFTARDAATQHEVSPFAGVETLARLVARGYLPSELSTVLVLEIPDAPLPPSPLQTRVIDPAVDGEAWVETSISGWAAEGSVADFIRTIAAANLKNPSMTHYVVEDQGSPIATGSLGMHDGVAVLAGASTIPSARARGAQSLLLARRLADARAHGCAIAMMVTAVGSQSQRNAERNGLRVAYTRTKWQRRCPALAE